MYVPSIAISICRQSQDLDLNPGEWEVMVTLNKERFPVKTCWSEDGFTVDIDGKKEVILNTDWLVGEPMMLADMNGKDVTVQVSGSGSLLYGLQFITASGCLQMVF